MLGSARLSMGVSLATRRAFPGLRRALQGLLVAGAILSTGCIIDEPPDLEPPERQAPRPLIDTAYPTLFQPFLTNTNGQQEFRIDFLVEDLDQPTSGALYLNFGAVNQVWLGRAESVATLPGDNRRSVIVPWTQNLTQAAGCYTITMAITYNDNLRSDIPLTPIDMEETAFVTWWIAHDIEAQNVNLDECYPPDAIPQETEQSP